MNFGAGSKLVIAIAISHMCCAMAQVGQAAAHWCSHACCVALVWRLGTYVIC